MLPTAELPPAIPSTAQVTPRFFGSPWTVAENCCAWEPTATDAPCGRTRILTLGGGPPLEDPPPQPTNIPAAVNPRIEKTPRSPCEAPIPASPVIVMPFHSPLVLQQV